MENKITKTICNRVSCRNFSDKKVSLSKIKTITKCGEMAPSAKNQQIVNILVLNSKKHVEKLRELSIEVLNRDCFYGAKTLALVYAPKDHKFCETDCSCVLENMFIAATSLNVNSCWINQVNDLFETEKGKKLKKKFGIYDEAKVVGTCALGYVSDGVTLNVKERKKDFTKIL